MATASRLEGGEAGPSRCLSGSMFQRQQLQQVMRETVQARVGQQLDQSRATDRPWVGRRIDGGLGDGQTKVG